jgi:hypothetical protein
VFAGYTPTVTKVVDCLCSFFVRRFNRRISHSWLIINLLRLVDRMQRLLNLAAHIINKPDRRTL